MSTGSLQVYEYLLNGLDILLLKIHRRRRQKENATSLEPQEAESEEPKEVSKSS